MALLREHDLSERHARALLRLQDDEDRLAAAREIAAHGWNVAQTEAYVETLLHRVSVEPKQMQPKYVLKDVRIFLNSIRRQLGIMQRAGVDAAVEREDTDEEIRMTIRIPRRAAEQPAG